MTRDPYASLKHGLVGAWIPSVSGSGLLLPDLSGRGNNGTLTNMDASDWVASEGGRALDFDGTDDRVIVGYKPEFLASNLRTFCGWINVRSFDGAFQANDIMSRDNAISGGVRDWNLAVLDANNNDIDGCIGIAIWGTGGGALFCDMSTDSMSINTWYHFTVTYDGGALVSGINIFINGQKQSVTTSTTGTFTAPSTSTNELWIGRRPGILSDLHFNGRMDDLRIYNRLLSESEIKLLASDRGIGFKRRASSTFAKRYTYKPPKAKVFEGVRVRDHDYASLRQGLVGAWCPSLANGGSGNILPDQSGRGNNGTLVGMGPEDWVASEGGRALDFDGSNDVVDIASRGTGVIPSQADFSVSIWLRSNVTPSATQAFFGQFIALAGNGRCYVGLNASGQVILFLGNDGTLGSVSVLSTTTVTANQWVHVAATRNFRTFSLAINGVVEATTTEASTRTILQTGNTIGLVDFGGTSYIGGPYFQQANGQVDDLRVYRKTLTESEIKLLASKRGIGLQPSPTRFIAKEKKTGLRRRILTGQT